MAGFIGTVCTDQRPFTSMLWYTDRMKLISKWEMIKNLQFPIDVITRGLVSVHPVHM